MMMVKDCRGCEHFRATAIFDLCTHPASEYRRVSQVSGLGEGTVEHHTIGHMRGSACADGRLFALPSTVLAA